MDSKLCKTCLKTLPLDLFMKSKRCVGGHTHQCKSCQKLAMKQYRVEHRLELREYDRIRDKQPHRAAHARQATKSWEVKYPERYKAHQVVAKAIISGKLKRLPCFVCGEKAEAHHPDYDRPLDVVWLCRPHHKETHDLIKG